MSRKVRDIPNWVKIATGFLVMFSLSATVWAKASPFILPMIGVQSVEAAALEHEALRSERNNKVLEALRRIEGKLK